jgi:hypothetical protein
MFLKQQPAHENVQCVVFEISAKKLDTTTLNPYPAIAQAACSLLILTKVFPPTRIEQNKVGLFNTNEGIV